MGSLIWGVCAWVISSSWFIRFALCVDANSGVGLECGRTCVGVGWVSSDVCMCENSGKFRCLSGSVSLAGGDPEPPRFQVLGERCLSRAPPAPPYPEVAIL